MGYKMNKDKKDVIDMQDIIVQAFDSFRGPKGEPGVGIKDVTLGEDNAFTFTMTDETTLKTGSVHLSANAAVHVYTVTLTAEGWKEADGLFSQTVSCPGIHEKDAPVADISQSGDETTDKPAREAWALVTRITTADDAITAYATEAPGAELTVQLKEVNLVE